MNTTSQIIGKRKAISNWLHQFITFIDLENRTFKTEERLLGIFRWGKYQPLPKINYVLVFKQLFAKCESCSIEEYEENVHSYYQVSLIYGNHKRIIVNETRNKEEAFKIGKQIADKLNTRLMDSATNRRKSLWII